MNSHSKGVVQLIIPVFLALVVFFGIGIFALKNGGVKIVRQRNNIPVTPTTVTLPSSTPNTEKLADIPKGWKTYTETLTGYQFSYPPEYTTDFIPYHLGSVILRLKNSKQSADASGEIVFISNSNSSAFSEVKDYVDNLIESSEGVAQYYNKQSKKLGNYEFYMVDGGCCMDMGRHAFLMNGNSVFEITLNWLDSANIPESQSRLFDQILSTFRFVDPDTITPQISVFNKK